MRTTLRIEDGLLDELKALAQREHIPLTGVVNRVLQAGLRALREDRQPSEPYHEPTCDLGRPRFPLDKALKIAAQMEDQEILRKLELRK
jgi:hypothetical protein